MNSRRKAKLYESYLATAAAYSVAREARQIERNRLMEAFGWTRWVHKYLGLGRGHAEPVLYRGQPCDAASIYWKNPVTGRLHHPNCGAYETAIAQVDAECHGHPKQKRRAAVTL